MTSVASRSDWRPAAGCGKPVWTWTRRHVARADAHIDAASLVAFYLPMHTATRRQRRSWSN
jgi:hypothetical protein